MRIALFTDGVHPYVIGGMQKHSFYLARQLARDKHTVYLFHYNESTYNASALEFFSPEERQCIKPFLLAFPHKKYFPFHYLYESYKYSETIHEAVKSVLPQTDFIFVQGFCAWALLKHRKKIQNIFGHKGTRHFTNIPPVAIHFHGFEMFQNIPSYKAKISRYFLQKAVKANLTTADYVLSYGGKVTALLNTMCPKQKIWEIPAGIEPLWLTEAVPANTNKARFAFIGRYERRKGLPELNMAIKRLLAKAEFTVDFIGEIPLDKRIDSPHIHYHGKISSETEIKKILSACDVLVCPSYAEGMPNVIMEAMACGLAVIATDVGAVSMLVDSANGWLIKSPNPDNIYAAMLAATQDRNLYAKKMNSYEKIKKQFMLKQVTDMLIENIKNAIHS